MLIRRGLAQHYLDHALKWLKRAEGSATQELREAERRIIDHYLKLATTCTEPDAGQNPRASFESDTVPDTQALADAQLLNALKLARAGAWQYQVEPDRFTFNDQFYSVYRTTAHAVGGYTMPSAEYINRFVHPGDAELVRRVIERTSASDNPVLSDEFEHRAIFGDGSTGRVLVRWFFIKDASGRTIMTCGINRDITEFRHVERRAGESELQFKRLVEQQVAGIVIIRQDGSLAYVNPRFAAMLGYAASEVIGKPMATFVVERDRDRMAARTDALVTGEVQSTPNRFAVRTRSGGTLDVLGQAATVMWDGQPALIGVIIDHSEQRRIERAMQHTIEALAGMVELRDPYTAGHQRRVAKLACAIAERLGMTQAQIDGLRLASAVHDIGKVQVPSEILSKPGPLSTIEYQIVQQHSEAGFNILKGIEFPWPVAETVLQHHERLDGSGYPQGLRGDAILPEAKVLAVADVVDSMMARRPYREALGLQAALDEIEAHKGKLYDPAAVEACTSLLSERGSPFKAASDSLPNGAS
ncbi:MAG: PAS domain S-box protein [Xanthobacteraceae bacterium]|nr:PAS domain S-box protein [Xanthobacteraceae bacterium]